MLVLTDPEFYCTFSKYYLCVSITASLLAITGFRHINIFKCTLATHAVRKQKKTTFGKKKKEEGEKVATCPGLSSVFKAGMMNPRKDKYTAWVRRTAV